MADLVSALLPCAWGYVHVAQALAAAEKARQLYEQAGDLWGVGQALNNIGFYRARVAALIRRIQSRRN